MRLALLDEFVAMRTAVEANRALRYKLRCFGIPIAGPTVLCGGKDAAIKSCCKVDARLNKKHNQNCFHAVREAAAMGEIVAVKEGTETNLADPFTKTLDVNQKDYLMDAYFRRLTPLRAEDSGAGLGPSGPAS